MTMTFQEKSLWLTLVALVVAFGGVFRSVWSTLLPAPVARDLLPQETGLFLSATLLMVMIVVVGHVVIAIVDRRTETDERGRWIELRGQRIGSFVLAVGVFMTLCAALVTEGNAVMAHLLLGSWVLAQAVETVAQLVLYRRGG